MQRRLAAATVVLLAACSAITLNKAGFPPLEITAGDATPADMKDEKKLGHTDDGSTRKDIMARMASAREPIAACYVTALAGYAKLAGTIEVEVQVEAKTGSFASVKLGRDDLGDPTLNDCVVAEIRKLKLAKPGMTKLTFRYQLHFTPPGDAPK